MVETRGLVSSLPAIDLNSMRGGLLNLIDQPILDLQDQQTMLVPEKNEIRLPALFPDGRPIPADEIRIRAGRLPKKSKDGPFARGGANEDFSKD